jgi:hypothetical protein
MYSWPWRFVVLSLTVLLLVYSTGWFVQINARALPNESELLGNIDVDSVGREAESTVEQAIDHLNDDHSLRASQVLSVGSGSSGIEVGGISSQGSRLLNPGSGSSPADASAHVLGTLSLLHTEGAVDVVCDRDVSWLPDAQLFSGMNAVWHDVSVPLCINGQPNLELLSFSGYGTGGYMGDLFELLSADGLSAITEWVESCSSGYNDFEITVPAQVTAKPVYDRLCWTAIEGAYLGGVLSVEGEECANCSIASIANLFPCTHGGSRFCDSEGYDYSVFDRSYDSSCSARARRSWLAMGVVAAEALHQDMCHKTQPATRLLS